MYNGCNLREVSSFKSLLRASMLTAEYANYLSGKGDWVVTQTGDSSDDLYEAELTREVKCLEGA